jgi:hypothetical protein
MKNLLITSIFLASLLLPYSVFATEGATITVTVQNSSGPLQMLNILGDLHVYNQTCSGSTCTFDLAGTSFLHTSGSYKAAVTIGKDWQHYCQLFFDDNGGWLFNIHMEFTNANCVGAWTAGKMDDNHIIIYGQ